MNKLFVFTIGLFLALSCIDKKKEDNKTKKAIETIDSIQVDIEKDIKQLEKTTEEVLKELENI